MRRLASFVISLIACVLFAVPAKGQDVCKSIAEAENGLYGFRPPKLTAAERNAKSKAMDSYWNQVKEAGPTGAECLRGLLQKQTDGFAVFDEAALLYSIDKSAESRDVVAQAVAKTDLSDVQPADYMRMGLRLAHDGADIEPIARNYLESPSNVTTYLPEHGGYELNRVRGALLLYGILPAEKMDDTLSKEVKSESAETRNVAAAVWSLNMTERSFKGLSELGNMTEFTSDAKRQVQSVMIPHEVRVSAPKYTREQLLAKIVKFPDFSTTASEDFDIENEAVANSVYATFTEADVATLREARRRSVTGVSDEAVDEYAEMSRVLLNLINKLHLYGAYRKAGREEK